MNLIESVYNEPDKWSLSKYTLIHESGAELWTCSGVWFCQPLEGYYSMINRFRAWRAYKWWVKNAPVEKLSV